MAPVPLESYTCSLPVAFTAGMHTALLSSHNQNPAQVCSLGLLLGKCSQDDTVREVKYIFSAIFSQPYFIRHLFELLCALVFDA